MFRFVKKDCDGTFDLTMGSFDGAEVRELVGLYILGILARKFKSLSIELYWDDGLISFYNTNS